MTGIRFAFTIALIPVFFVLLALAGLVGGGLGCAVYTPADSVAWAIGVALPIFFLILGIPSVGGSEIRDADERLPVLQDGLS